MENHNKKHKSNPITPKQKEILVEFISARKEMYTGKFTPMYTKEKMLRNWEEVTNILNSVPDGPAKDWKQWRKTWVDIKKNTKSRHSEQRKYLAGSGGGPPPFSPTNDLPGIEEKVLNIITPVAISGNNNVSETEVSFEFDTNVYDDIPDLSHTEDVILEKENILESYASEHKISSFVINKNDVHDYCTTENSKDTIDKKPRVIAENSNRGSTQSSSSLSSKKRMNKSSRLQQSLQNNEKFLKLSEDSIITDKEYKTKKILLLENDCLHRSMYYDRKATALETMANAQKQIAMDIQIIKKVMLESQKHSN